MHVYFSTFCLHQICEHPIGQAKPHAKPGMKVGGKQELQGREPNTGRPTQKPLMQSAYLSSQIKGWNWAKKDIWKQNAVSSHYLQIPYLQIHLLAKFGCNLKINTWGTYIAILIHA